MLFQRSNTANVDYKKDFYAYIKVIKYYGGKPPTNPGLVKAKLINMGVQDTKNTTL